jgi:AcrR family transcriptional regulator
VTTRQESSASPAEPDPGSAPDGWARRRQRVASDIEQAALQLFADRGPDATSVEQIAEAAGISVRTFFRYFPTRDDLMLALPQRQVEGLCAAALSRPSHESVLEAFIGAVRMQGEAPEEELLRLWGLALQKGAIPSHDQLQPSGGMVTAYAAVIAQRVGIEPSDVRAQVMATAIGGVMWSSFVRWLESSHERGLADVIEESFTILADLDHHGTPPGPRPEPAGA